MEMQTDKKQSVWRSLDWWTVGIYIALLIFGWFSICGASYSYSDTNFFSLDSRTGMQIIWIGTAIVLAFVIMMTDSRYFDTFAFIIYGLFLVLLFVTIFNPHEIKGSKSWLVIGPLRLQPAEFAKFATALALSKLMSDFNFSFSHWRDTALALAVIFVPMLLIVAQKETGSALVYIAFFLMFYREGMPGSVLFTGVAMVVYFVVGVKYADVMLWITPTSVGEYAVLLMIQIFSSVLVYVYCKDNAVALRMLGISIGITAIATLFAIYVIPFDITWVQIVVTLLLVLFLAYQWLRTRITQYMFIMLFAIGSATFFYSADYVLENVMQSHQRVRINVLLGLEEDLAGAGYNVNQSKIAIGSGGLRGKGFLNGTQTKLKYVPEQDTDFIFCTVGEEEGFLGSAGLLMLFLALILRLIHLAERQPFAFGRIYGYCVMSIFLFHLFINVGMVLGLTPVIGIPLPFFSYGGSSLWGFTILLFIFLRIDANRNNRLLS
jgi:rod shape determining protein RodA